MFFWPNLSIISNNTSIIDVKDFMTKIEKLNLSWHYPLKNLRDKFDSLLATHISFFHSPPPQKKKRNQFQWIKISDRAPTNVIWHSAHFRLQSSTRFFFCFLFSLSPFFLYIPKDSHSLVIYHFNIYMLHTNIDEYIFLIQFISLLL